MEMCIQEVRHQYEHYTIIREQAYLWFAFKMLYDICSTKLAECLSN